LSLKGSLSELHESVVYMEYSYSNPKSIWQHVSQWLSKITRTDYKNDN